MTRQQSKFWGKSVKAFICVLSCVATVASAMVVRHDVPAENYVEDESNFPAIFPVADNGKTKECVATLISPNWAVTAAHCTILIKHDELDKNPHEVMIANQINQVTQFFIPKEFGQSNMDFYHNQNFFKSILWLFSPPIDLEYDIALLKLANPVKHVEPLKLFQGGKEIGNKILLLGWGDFGTGDQGIDRENGVNDRKFRIAWNQITKIKGNSLIFVFDDPRLPNSKALPLEGVNGPGDSGGPALISTEEGYQVIGISSSGRYPDDMESNYEGQYGWLESYIRISALNDWITETMENN